MLKLHASRGLAAAMIAVMVVCAVPDNVAQAAMVSTDQVFEQQSVVDQRARIGDLLRRADVREHMAAMGVDLAEAARRIATLSDDEIARIAGRLDELPAGQGAVGAVVGAALIIFLVLLVTDILGFTNVFGFVRK